MKLLRSNFPFILSVLFSTSVNAFWLNDNNQYLYSPSKNDTSSFLVYKKHSNSLIKYVKARPYNPRELGYYPNAFYLQLQDNSQETYKKYCLDYYGNNMDAYHVERKIKINNNSFKAISYCTGKNIYVLPVKRAQEFIYNEFSYGNTVNIDIDYVPRLSFSYSNFLEESKKVILQ